ncbi:MAG: Asp-tRNA(Asn)/Glu-tRNA(Gln) amidotransferase subunit GatA [Ruminococcaceae bacterium]|nr:Asp-tRNA(Asn)/Glu-tRNA(Gln) amidotransferase subunit GatA [Oscillospiraceae bacterium]
MSELLKRGLVEHAEALEKKEYSSHELVEAYLSRIEKRADMGTFITVDRENALKNALDADQRRATGKALGRFDGIPIALKDNICTEGLRTTCASKMLCDYTPPYNATVISRLRRAGLILLGKTNMDEFSMGSSTESSAFGATKNPRDPLRVAGGSSGGSAAAVADCQAPIALGSDTGGSVRQPSAFCGCVGMKPTYGRVSRYGLVAFSPSIEQIGPITKNIRDNAELLSIISGHDKMDSTTLRCEREDFSADIGKDIKGVRIGLPKELFELDMSDTVREGVMGAAEIYRQRGAAIKTVSLPSLRYALSAYYIISAAEASSNLARFDGIRYGHRAEDIENIDELFRRSRSEGFGDEVKRRIMLGTFVLSAGHRDEFYRRALSVKELVRKDFDAAFCECDVILCPVAPTVAPKLGEKRSPTEIYRTDAFCVPASIAGLPALSIPSGLGENSMPVGVQLIAPALSEALLYRVGAALEARKEGV